MNRSGLYNGLLFVFVVVLFFFNRETRKEVDAQLSALVTRNTSEIFCSTYEEVVASIDKVRKHVCFLFDQTCFIPDSFD